MNFNYLLQQTFFIFRFRYFSKYVNLFNVIWLRVLGMKIGKGTDLSRILVTWPHQVSFGKNCLVERGVSFKYDGIWSAGPSINFEDDVFIGMGCEFNISSGIQVGKKTMIASGCKFIDHNHGTALNEAMNGQIPIIEPISIADEVWFGANCIVLKGVKIEKGAVIGAGSLVLKNIGEYEIWGGNPAKYIKKRT